MTNTLFKKIVFYLIIASVLVLIGLTILVHYHPVLNFDIRTSLKVQSEGDTIFEKYILIQLLSFVSFLGQTTVAFTIVIFTAIVFWIYDHHWESLFSLISACSVIANSIFKLLINRPRPSSDLVYILDHQLSPSYPSGHVVFFTAFFGFLIASLIYTKNIKLWVRVFFIIISFSLITSVSISRIFLGAHWITDVLAGYLFGLIYLLVVLFFYQKRYSKKTI